MLLVIGLRLGVLFSDPTLCGRKCNLWARMVDVSILFMAASVDVVDTDTIRVVVHQHRQHDGVAAYDTVNVSGVSVHVSIR